MNTELRLHGQVNDKIEYFATAAGCRTAHHHFFQINDNNIRFFSAGNELCLDAKGVTHSGTGGMFCEYMFGAEQPLSDLSKEVVRNRLLLLGAGYNTAGSLEINDQCHSEQTYSKIFRGGHAIDNYFFFINGLEGDNHQSRQKQLLLYLGKTLKRLPNLNQRDDSQLAELLLSQLPDQCTVYLIRLSATRYRHFKQEFQTLYYRDRSISTTTTAILQSLADNMKLNGPQCDRIKTDVMYRHRDNYRIIDDYKKVLIECYHQGNISKQQHARLTRLEALAMRKEIPPALLNALDKRLKSKTSNISQEPEYTAITRDIFHDLQLRKELTTHDIIQLLHAKQSARREHDHSFEQLLLETGQHFDERIREGEPLSLLEDFSYIISFFDRYDNTATNVSQIAFMENCRPTEDLIHSLIDSRHEFNQIGKGLFGKLFFAKIMSSNFLGRYGRKKLVCLKHGLEEIAAGKTTPHRLTAELKHIDNEERIYGIVLSYAKKRIRNRYSSYDTKEQQHDLHQELNNELLMRGKVSKAIDKSLFHRVIHDIKTEAIYLRQLLPDIIANNDTDLRKDFLTNSGLDYFYVEELEREYYTQNQLETEHLQQLRAGAF